MNKKIKIFSTALICMQSYLFADTYTYLLDGITLNYTDTGFSSASGFYDANKLYTVDENADDMYLCWAFAASNQIAYWQDNLDDYYQSYMIDNNIPTGTGSTYEYAVTDTFVSSFENTGGFEEDGFTWWVYKNPSTTYIVQSTTTIDYDRVESVDYSYTKDDVTYSSYYNVYYYKDEVVYSDKENDDDYSYTVYSYIDETGGYIEYTEEGEAEYVDAGYWSGFVSEDSLIAEEIKIFDLDDLLEAMDLALENCYGMTLGIYSAEGDEGHAMTLWGYSYDEETDTYSLFISDSDDEISALTEHVIYLDEDGKIFFSDEGATTIYYSDISDAEYDDTSIYANAYIDDITLFYGFGVAVPEPSTYTTILGLFALGFVAYRRRK